MSLLTVKNISKHTGGNIIIDNISFTQERLQKVAIAGESGAGKTTLLKMITGHAQPTSGVILFDNEKVKGTEEKLLPGHNKMAYLSQHYELLNNYRVEELIWFENTLPENKATELFEICRIQHLLQRRTDKLSGGEKQRIALCMLLVRQPEMLVLDEPFSNLDPIHTGIIKEVIDDVMEQLSVTCMLASHEPHDTLSWADEILVIQNGKIVQQAAPQIIYHQPVNEYVAGLFGKYNLLSAKQAALFGIKTKGHVMIRPEEFMITKNMNEGVKGIIQKISFWGSFYEAEVSVGEMKIVVRIMSGEWKNGEEAYLKLISKY